MWNCFTSLLIFTFLHNANTEHCSDPACPSDTECISRSSHLSALFIGEVSGTDSSCEDQAIGDILHINDKCQDLQTSICLPYMDCDTRTATDGCMNFVSLDIAFSSSSTHDPTNCTSNDALKSAVDALLSSCMVSDELSASILCDNALPTDCPDWAQEDLTNYPQCACNVLFNAVGVLGYPYIPTINGWIQAYLAQAGTTIECPDLSILDIDCTGLILDCDVNDDILLSICNELEQIPSDVAGYVEVTLGICASYVPKALKRHDLWKDLKKGIEDELELHDVLIDYEAFISHYATDGKGKNKNDAIERNLGVVFECDQDNTFIAAKLTLVYEEFNDLITLITAYQDAVLFNTDVRTLIAASTLIDIEAFFLQLKLYNEGGSEYIVSVDTVPNGASCYSFAAIVVVLALAMIVWG